MICFFVFLINTRPPISTRTHTLSPYTSLFRSRFAGYGLPVAADSVEGFAVPLAGVLAGLDWVVANRPDAQWVVTVPTDAPAFPLDPVARLHAAVAADRAELACAA